MSGRCSGTRRRAADRKAGPLHIVVVDDDDEIRRLLTRYFETHGFRATAVADAQGLDRLLARQHADLIVLDWVLPGEDGLSICRRLRVAAQAPVIMLTARNDELDRIIGLEVGAEDYVIKPFNPRELLARVKNVLRRCQAAPREAGHPHRVQYRFAGWVLDTGLRELRDSTGRKQALSGSEYRLLLAFASHPGRVLTRHRLMELTRAREADPFDRSIDVLVSRLRRLLSKNGCGPGIIKAVYGEGYVFGATIEID